MSDLITPTVEGLFGLRQEEYLHISSTALFVYDYMITFDDEIFYVWKRPKGVGSILYFLNRYPAFIDLSLSLYNRIAHGMPKDRCIHIDNIVGWMFFVGIIIAEIIMLMRVWSLWKKTRSVTIFLSLLGTAGLVAGGVVFGVSHDSLTYVPMEDIAPTMPGCYPLGSNKSTFIDYTILMGIETVILLMTLTKCVKRSHLCLPSIFNPSSLFSLLLRDGIIYFVGLAAASFTNVIMLLIQSQADDIALQRCLHSVLVSRIFIHLRSSETAADLTCMPNIQRESREMGPLAFVHTPQSTYGGVNSCVRSMESQLEMTEHQAP